MDSDSFAMSLANAAGRKVGAFDLVNTDEDLLATILTEVERLDGDHFAHTLGLK